MSSTQALCCDLDIKGLNNLDDNSICDECHNRIDAYYEDLQLEWAMEDYYERKYSNGSKD
jgi:hypothetical protein